MGSNKELLFTRLMSSKFARRLLEDLTQNAAEVEAVVDFDYPIKKWIQL